MDSLTLPVAEYEHTRGCAIVSGAIYRGDAYSGLKGLFIVADFCTGHFLGAKRFEGDQAQKGQTGWRSTLLAKAGIPASSLGEDEEGNVYITVHAENEAVVYILTNRLDVNTCHV